MKATTLALALGLTSKLLALPVTGRADTIYLHCLPADIGAEVSPGVMERFRTDVAREANKKVYVIMALLAAAKVSGLAERLGALE